MSDNAMPKSGDVIADKYKIEEVLGQGGMGAVFSATHQITGRRVALKWMHQELAQNEEAVQRFIREAQAAGRIDHPNVVDVYDVGRHGDTVFLVMEYLRGEPLSALLARESLPVAAVIQLLMPALRGVAAAHKRGVIHRDIKPDNIYLCRGADGEPRDAKVLDFGISKMSSQEGQVSPRLTRTGAVMGTPYYMSPEQVRGCKELGQQADVYAFGVILYEALTGRVPFDAETFSALVVQIATGTPAKPRELRPELPADLDAVVMKAMAREPAERYPDIESLARALEPWAGGVAFDVERRAPTAGHIPMTRGSSATGVDTSTPFAAETPIEIPGRTALSGAVVGALGAAALLIVGFGAWAFLGKSGSMSKGMSHDPGPPAAAARSPERSPSPTSSETSETPSTQAASDNKAAAGPASRLRKDVESPGRGPGPSTDAAKQLGENRHAHEGKSGSQAQASEADAPKADIPEKDAVERGKPEARTAPPATRRARRSKRSRPSRRRSTGSTAKPERPDAAAPAGRSTPGRPTPVRPPINARTGTISVEDF